MKMQSIAKPDPRRVKVKRNNNDASVDIYTKGLKQGFTDGVKKGSSEGYDIGYVEGLEQGKKVGKADAEYLEKTTKKPVVVRPNVEAGSHKFVSMSYAFEFITDREVITRQTILRAIIFRRIGNKRTSDRIGVLSRINTEDFGQTRLDRAQAMERMLVGLAVQATPYCDSMIFIEALLANILPNVRDLFGVDQPHSDNLRKAMYRAVGIRAESAS